MRTRLLVPVRESLEYIVIVLARLEGLGRAFTLAFLARIRLLLSKLAQSAFARVPPFEHPELAHERLDDQVSSDAGYRLFPDVGDALFTILEGLKEVDFRQPLVLQVLDLPVFLIHTLVQLLVALAVADRRRFHWIVRKLDLSYNNFFGRSRYQSPP